MTHLFCIAFDTRRLPAEESAALARVIAPEGGSLERLRASTSALELVGLATCNRAELYAVGPETCALRKGLLALLESETGRPWRTDYVVLQQDRAAEHLMRVTSGIDSLVVGEREILGQVRRAFDDAATRGLAGDVLTRLFRRALATGRRARHDTAISRGNVSVASVAVEVASRARLGGLGGARIVVVGTGDTAGQVLSCLRRHVPGEVVILSADPSRAARLAASAPNTRAVRREEMHAVLATAGVAFFATRVDAPIVRARDCSGLRNPDGSPLLMLDLSVPPCVEPGVDALPSVRLMTMAHLEEAARENMAQRTVAIHEVEAMIAEAMDAWRAREREQSARTLADDLFRHLEERRRAQLDRIAEGLAADQRALLDQATRSILRGVLHDLSREVRSLSEADEEALVRRLFGLSPAGVPSVPGPSGAEEAK